MPSLENSILEIVKTSNGVKAREIAKKLHIERAKVNSLLYGKLSKECCVDSQYNWYLKSSYKSVRKQNQEKVIVADMRLKQLCEYYLACINLEGSNSIYAYLRNKYTPQYIEIKSMDFTSIENDGLATFLMKSSGQRNMSNYLGYPNLIEKRYSSKTNEYFYVVIPVFLYQVEYNGGAVEVSSVPSINMEIIKKYAEKDANSQIYELIELENQLGLNSSNIDFDLGDVVAKLQNIRQWEWKENIDPDKIDITVPIDKLLEEGIYNRAIVLTTEKSPYTQGLEGELAELSQMSEASYKGTALWDWIHGENIYDEKDASKNYVIDVLPLNSEQEAAIKESLSSNLTIVTGPPGTGKSQVVTDLLINSAWIGKNVLFTSKNNKAVDVVEKRVNEIGNKPILLRIGNNRYATHLAELIEALLSSSVDNNDEKEYQNFRKQYIEHYDSLIELEAKKREIITLRNKVDELDQKYSLIRDEYAQFFYTIDDDFVEELNELWKQFKNSYVGIEKSKQKGFIQLFWFVIYPKRKEIFDNYCAEINKKIKKINLKPFPDNLSERIFKSRATEVERAIISLHLMLEYKSLLDDLTRMPSLPDIDKNIIDKKEKASKIAENMWKKWLQIRPFDVSQTQRVEMNQYVTAMKLAGNIDINTQPDLKKKFSRLQKVMTKYLPCWAVTSLSAKGRIPFQAGLFDLLVIDEASQCDIASILPLLYRSKRVVIIGDPKQLSHISSIPKQQDLTLLQKYNIELQWSYHANSLYDLASILTTSNKIIHLRDHHRSYADIIEFSNKEFYDGKLRVATNYSRLKQSKDVQLGIQWDNIIGKTVRPKEGGAFNTEEINAVIAELKRLVKSEYKGEIGVVTPFRLQAEKIREKVDSDKELSESLISNNFLVDTVHKFQGDERDIIIFSPVISNGTSNGAIQFLNNTGNLFNVAITRARSCLKVIGDIKYCSECKVQYMENFVKYVKDINKNVTKDDICRSYGRQYPEVSNKEQVSDWEVYFYQALYDEGIKTIPQYPADKYKLDLAIILGNKKLDIEVDGEMYHKDWNGELCYRDQLRNQRLMELGWDVQRFWVYQLRDNLPQCIKKIKDWIIKNQN